MATVATYSCQPGIAAFDSGDLLCRPVALPYGGPTDAGGPFVQMSALTLVATVAQPEIWVITAAGSGTFTMQFTDGYGTNVATTAVSSTAGTAAQVLASLQTIFPTWMLAAGSVTGSAGGPWTVTFGGNYRVGGRLQFVTTTGTGSASFSRSQRGCVGAGQYDVYNGTTFTTVNALLKHGLNVGLSGGLATTPYGPISDETWPASAYMEGFFNYADIPNITTAAVASGNVPGLTWHVGSATATGGAIVKLNQ